MPSNDDGSKCITPEEWQKLHERVEQLKQDIQDLKDIIEAQKEKFDTGTILPDDDEDTTYRL